MGIFLGKLCDLDGAAACTSDDDDDGGGDEEEDNGGCGGCVRIPGVRRAIERERATQNAYVKGGRVRARRPRSRARAFGAPVREARAATDDDEVILRPESKTRERRARRRRKNEQRPLDAGAPRDPMAREEDDRTNAHTAPAAVAAACLPASFPFPSLALPSASA